jgi:hypothetical protein
VGVEEGADSGDKIKKKPPPRGGLWGRRGAVICYLDNIEISEAKRETLLFACPFCEILH